MRALFFIFLFLVGGRVSAADAACDALKTPASCPEAKAHALLELSSQLRKCQTRVETAKCDEFWKEHPKYKAHANVCAPADVCLFRTVEGFEDGCNALGISFTKKYKEGCGDGVMKDSCMAWHVLQETFLDLLPYLKGPLLGGKSLITPLVQGAEELPDAYRFARHLSCVDNLTRNKIACYIAVHGGMIVLSAGARAASEYAAIAKEVEELEVTSLPVTRAPPPPDDAAGPAALARIQARESVQDVRLTNQAIEHSNTHLGLSFAQRRYLDNVVKLHAEGKIKTADDASYWLENPSISKTRAGTVNPEPGTRPFRAGKKTSLFPSGVTQDDIFSEFKKGNFEAVGRADRDVAYYRVPYKGDVYRVAVCKENCAQAGAAKNEVVSVFPECGPNIRFVLPLKDAKSLLTGTAPLTANSFFQPDPCP